MELAYCKILLIMLFNRVFISRLLLNAACKAATWKIPCQKEIILPSENLCHLNLIHIPSSSYNGGQSYVSNLIVGMFRKRVEGGGRWGTALCDI